MKITNAGKYRLTVFEHLQLLTLWIIICGAAGWMFYDTLLLALVGLPGYFLFFPVMRRFRENQCRRQLSLEFKDTMISVYSSLSAGATVEQSMSRALADMERSLKPDARMLQELTLVCRKMERNVPVTQCLEEMARRCQDKDIENFAQILILGKKQGGNLAAFVRDSVEKIQRRIEITYEIEGLIGAKRNEFLFMCGIPPGIILYMRICSPEFMSVLYGNLPGRLAMTACLVVYMAAVAIGIWILKLKNE